MIRAHQAVHIVQVGSDDSVFRNAAPSDTLERQVRYGEILSKKNTGSQISTLILTRLTDTQRISYKSFLFVPVRSPRILEPLAIWGALVKLNLERQIDVISPQDVNVVGWVCWLFAKINLIPVIAQIHYDLFSSAATRVQMGTGLFGLIRRKVTFFLLQRFTAVRVVGQAVKTGIVELGLHKDVTVIPVPVTLLEGNLEPAGHNSTGTRVLYVGRLDKEKNLPFWLQIAKRIHDVIPEIEFDIVGMGAQENRLRSLTHQLNIEDRVHFHGSIPYDQLGEFYQNAAVFLLTSEYEGFGRVAVEASAFGLPVVAPKIRGIEDIVLDQQTGILFSPNDVDDAARCVLRLLASPETRRTMGASGRSRVLELFSPQRLAEAWVDFLVHVIPDPTFLSPLRPTLKRWFNLSSTKYSLLRSLEYEAISELVLRGRTLDVGGGKNNSYYDKISFEGVVDSVNIDAKMRPDIVADLNYHMPIKNEVYDNFMSLNTFEHIEQDELAIREAFRVLKPGGTFHIIIPFLYKVHGSPFDFHRHTAYWWSEFIQKLGVAKQNIVIDPLIWDPASSAFSITEYYGWFKSLQKQIVMLDAVRRSLRWFGVTRLPRLCGKMQSEYAIGYYIAGKR